MNNETKQSEETVNEQRVVWFDWLTALKLVPGALNYSYSRARQGPKIGAQGPKTEDRRRPNKV